MKASELKQANNIMAAALEDLSYYLGRIVIDAKPSEDGDTCIVKMRFIRDAAHYLDKNSK